MRYIRGLQSREHLDRKSRQTFLKQILTICNLGRINNNLRVVKCVHKTNIFCGQIRMYIEQLNQLIENMNENTYISDHIINNMLNENFNIRYWTKEMKRRKKKSIITIQLIANRNNIERNQQSYRAKRKQIIMFTSKWIYQSSIVEEENTSAGIMLRACRRVIKF